MELANAKNSEVQESDIQENLTNERENMQSATKKYKQDGVWSWVVCLSASLSIALVTGVSFSYGVLLPVFMDYFKVSREKTGRFLDESAKTESLVWLGYRNVCQMHTDTTLAAQIREANIEPLEPRGYADTT